MNYLFGQINTNHSCTERLTSDNFENSDISLVIKRECGNTSFIKEDNIVIGMAGEIYEKTNTSELNYLLKIFKKDGIDGVHSINGFFTAVIINLTEQEIYIFQDKNTSLERLYYYLQDSKLFISTSISHLLNNCNLDRKVNTAILPTYLHYSFTPGNETLIKGLYKIPSGCFLKYCLINNSITLEKFSEYNTEYNSQENLIDLIDSSIRKRLDCTQKQGFSLSGGFDSNLLFSRALQFVNDEAINTFSYGYNSNTSEIKNVERIIKIYRQKGYKINHYEYMASTKDIYKLPQIISFLQEPILEPGLIFHYGMAELIKEQNIKILLGGDCNDQVYDKRLYYDMIAKMQEPLGLIDYPVYGRLRLGEFDRIHTYKYFSDIEILWLLNKEIACDNLKIRLEVYSDIFTNYFMTKRFFVREHNTSVRLPFLDKDYVNYINTKARIEDLPFKKGHINLCKRYMDEDVYKELVNATEATSPYSYLFLEDDTIRNEIFYLIKNSDVTKEYFSSLAINTLLESFIVALEHGRRGNGYYKASILSCRIFAILGFIVWHNIFIQNKSSSISLYDLLSN